MRLKMAIPPMSCGKNRMSHLLEKRGSLISVPLALRVCIYIYTYIHTYEISIPKNIAANIQVTENIIYITSPESQRLFFIFGWSLALIWRYNAHSR